MFEVCYIFLATMRFYSYIFLANFLSKNTYTKQLFYSSDIDRMSNLNYSRCAYNLESDYNI